MDPQVRKKVLRQITYGLYVLTTGRGQEVRGGTVNWLSQASFQPPLVMVGVKKDSDLYRVLERTGIFAINFLSADQKGLAQDFFRPSQVEGDRLNGHPFRPGSTGAPILEEVYAWAECRLVDRLEGGDHAIVVGEVVDAGLRREDRPLVMWDTGWFYGG